MDRGDLVNLYAYSPHDSMLANTITCTGIFIEMIEDDLLLGGWRVLVGDQVEAFSKAWWKCKKVK